MMKRKKILHYWLLLLFLFCFLAFPVFAEEGEVTPRARTENYERNLTKELKEVQDVSPKMDEKEVLETHFDTSKDLKNDEVYTIEEVTKVEDAGKISKVVEKDLVDSEDKDEGVKESSKLKKSEDNGRLLEKEKDALKDEETIEMVLDKDLDPEQGIVKEEPEEVEVSLSQGLEDTTNEESKEDEMNGDIDSPKDEVENLERGTVLELQDLAKEERSFGLMGFKNPISRNPIMVSNFEELKDAIVNAPDHEKVTILVTKSFEMTESIPIGENKEIILTAGNKKPSDGKWEPIKQPADYKSQGEKKQREIIEEARKRGEDALEKGDLDRNPLPSEEKMDIILKRSKEMIQNSLFKVLGNLQLGTEELALYIDGGKTEIANQGIFFDVDGTLVMENAVLMNGKASGVKTAPVHVKKGGTFTMNGGRISNNEGFAGAVVVGHGGTFVMNHGIIDNNNRNYPGEAGAIYAGTVNPLKTLEDPSIVNINGGMIVHNGMLSKSVKGGGIVGNANSRINVYDGIIAGNQSEYGGGLIFSDQYIKTFSNFIGGEYANTYGDYEEYVKKNKSEGNILGGLIYKNESSGNGGGLRIDTNHVTFGKTMILDNSSVNFGGGMYISFPPRTQVLENLLITENEAKRTSYDFFGGGNGGGLWNCPNGYVHIGDGHSVYIYNNNAE
ncbi:MAG: hypothetical protein Q4Q07_10520, partial [Tissierellia bacterium]|nr:hypothetical protein [Tissierellia bacterium]